MLWDSLISVLQIYSADLTAESASERIFGRPIAIGPLSVSNVGVLWPNVWMD